MRFVLLRSLRTPSFTQANADPISPVLLLMAYFGSEAADYQVPVLICELPQRLSS